MVVFIGLSTTGPDPDVHQILELVVITTDDQFVLKSVSPSYVLHRAPGTPLSPDKQAQHTRNNLLAESALSHRKPMHVEDLLLEQFGWNNSVFNKSAAVFNSNCELRMTKKHFPNFYETIGGKLVFYSEFEDPVVSKRYDKPGRALEDLLIVISETKRLRPW